MDRTTSALLRALAGDIAPDFFTTDPAYIAWCKAGYPGAEPLPTTPRYRFVVERDPEPESPADWLDGDTRCFIEANHPRFSALLSEKQAEVLSFGRYRRVPVFAYIHGGVRLFLSEADADRAAGAHAGWDTGRIGWMHIGPADAENPDPDKLAEDIVEAWNMYLSGDVWCWRVLDPDGEVVESLSNCYGEDSAREEGEAALASFTLVDEDDTDAAPPLVNEASYAACMAALSDPTGPRRP